MGIRDKVSLGRAALRRLASADGVIVTLALGYALWRWWASGLMQDGAWADGAGMLAYLSFILTYVAAQVLTRPYRTTPEATSWRRALPPLSQLTIFLVAGLTFFCTPSAAVLKRLVAEGDILHLVVLMALPLGVIARIAYGVAMARLGPVLVRVTHDGLFVRGQTSTALPWSAILALEEGRTDLERTLAVVTSSGRFDLPLKSIGETPSSFLAAVRDNRAQVATRALVNAGNMALESQVDGHLPSLEPKPAGASRLSDPLLTRPPFRGSGLVILAISAIVGVVASYVPGLIGILGVAVFPLLFIGGYLLEQLSRGIQRRSETDTVGDDTVWREALQSRLQGAAGSAGIVLFSVMTLGWISDSGWFAGIVSAGFTAFLLRQLQNLMFPVVVLAVGPRGLWAPGQITGWASWSTIEAVSISGRHPRRLTIHRPRPELPSLSAFAPLSESDLTLDLSSTSLSARSFARTLQALHPALVVQNADEGAFSQPIPGAESFA